MCRGKGWSRDPQTPEPQLPSGTSACQAGSGPLTAALAPLRAGRNADSRP